MDEAGGAQGVIDDIYGTFYVAALIGILDAQNKFSVLGFCKQVCKELGESNPYCKIENLVS